jgi:hypothetical protein
MAIEESKELKLRKLLAALCSLVLVFAVGFAWVPGAEAFGGVANDFGVRVRAAPSLSARIIGGLSDGDTVNVIDSASGSSVGGNRTWYQLASGGWVHSSLISRGGSTSSAPFNGRWIDVDISSQTARAMIGDRVVYTAPVTTGRPGWETPRGTFRINRRVVNKTMDSSTIGIPRDAPGGYYLRNVLYTQFFNNVGDALHYNYWMPDSVFGRTPTSHGCVGMRLADARYFWDFASIGTPVRIHD